jgi:two-component system sensor histidine kinase/response regulator
MDGIEVARAISRDPTLAGIPMVLLTSASEDRAEDARAAGISARLSKPVHLSQLHTTLATAVGAERTGGRVASDPPQDQTRGHLLVVEDNPVNQMVAVGILEHLGYTCEVASNGRAALDALVHAQFDAVLMDCQMPEMDGYQATVELRRTENARRTPVIAMTAGVTAAEQARCVAAGMDDFVAKPVSPDTLDGALARCLPAATS